MANASIAEVTPLLLTIDQTCAVLSTSRAHLYRLLGRGLLRPVKIGRNIRFPVTEVQRYVDNLIAEQGGGNGNTAA